MAGVPTLDLAAFRGPGRDAFAAALDAACREVGFLLIEGHGVPEPLIARVHALSAAFFAQPPEYKKRFKVVPGRIHGWTGPRQSYLADTLEGNAAPDWKEGFSVGPIDTPADLTHEETPYFGRNLWPDQPDGFVEAWEDYYREMERLAREIMAAMAVALALPEDYFDSRIDRHITGLSAHHYPAQGVPPLEGQLRAGAHTDFGSLTILHAGDNPDGLQVRGPDGAWHDVAIPPGCFVVNIGDLLAQWTNGRWVSTLHRVANPPGGRAHLPRQSIAFFHQPNWHTVVTCLPGCGSAENLPKYPPVTSGEHFERKLALLRGTGIALP